MNDRYRPLPLQDVFEIVERRRARRARVKAVAGPVAAVGVAGLTGLVVVVLQSGSTQVTPAAPPTPPTAALTTAEPTTAPPAATVTGSAPAPIDRDYLDPDYLDTLVSSYFGQEPPQDVVPIGDEATAVEQNWGLDFYPEAKAVVVKARGTGTPIDTADPRGADALISRFEEAGYTDADAAELADAWGTDQRTAKIMGALLVAAG